MGNDSLSKTCTKCKETKPYEEFHRHKRTLDGFNSWCKPCNSSYSKSWYSKNRDWHPTHKREYHRRVKYGLSPEDYSLLVLEQKGKCKICDEIKDGLCVDHCHTSGKVRGLLCRECNSALGMLKDKVSNFYSAIKYLENN